MNPNAPCTAGNTSAVVDDDIIDRVQTACTSILRLIILFKERGLLQDKYMLIIRGLARKLLEPSPEKSKSPTASCPVHTPASLPQPVACPAAMCTSVAPSSAPSRRVIACQPNSALGEDMPNWQGCAQANKSFSPSSYCPQDTTPAASRSAGNLQQCEVHPMPQSEHRGISPEELFNSDYLDQLMHVSEPGNYEDFQPDFTSSRVLEDPDEANRPKKCRKHELLARLRHHHCN